MLALASQLAQINPSDTLANTAFTGNMPISEITSIFVCNTTGGAVSFSIYHDDDGTTYGAATALYLTVNIAANTTTKIEFHGAGGGISVLAGGSIGVQSSVANALTFTLYGVTTKVTGQLI